MTVSGPHIVAIQERMVEGAAGKPDSANDGQPDCSNMGIDGIAVVDPRIDDGSPNSCCCILVSKVNPA